MLSPDSDARAVLLSGIRLLRNLPPSSRSRKVFLVPKQWHDRLLAWLDGASPDPPPAVDNSVLLALGLFDAAKRFHADFEAVEEAGWQLITAYFACAHPIPRQLIVHPTTFEAAVLADPVRLEISTPSGFFVKIVDGAWALGDLCLPLASRLALPAHCHFVHSLFGTPVADTTTVGEYVRRNGARIRLQVRPLLKAKTLNAISEETALIAAQPRFPGSPSRPTFAAKPLPSEFPRLIGLINHGNTCYLNSALQVLCRVEPLTRFLLAPDFADHINEENRSGSGGLIAREYREFVKSISRAELSARDPSALHREIGRSYPQFNISGQHDAQELLFALLDGLHEDLTRQNEPNDGLTPRSRRSRERIPTKPPSIIGDLFYGALHATVKCPECENSEAGYDPFVCLSLPLPAVAVNPVPLKDCIRRFLSSETLGRTEMWFCPVCKKPVRAVKRTVIYTAPAFLILHLSRFASAEGTASKIATTVDYPGELELSEFTQTRAGKYRLIGVVMHSGTLAFGHYTAAAMDPGTQQWYLFNDASVTAAGERFVRSSRAYILVYQEERADAGGQR
jgi:ubiquitin carboxyl-terminal hydrolase 8